MIRNCSSGGLVAYADSRSDDSVEKPQLPPRKKVVVLGTGWGGTTFLRNLDSRLYDVQVISPRNYFAFTPLLPSVTSGTVEPRSIVEPIRRVLAKKGGEIKFWEAECFKIDPANKKIHCRSSIGTNLDGNGEFLVDYDYLVVAVGARVNTFNTPGVVENCHFLKVILHYEFMTWFSKIIITNFCFIFIVSTLQGVLVCSYCPYTITGSRGCSKIRRSVMDCFERASLPYLNEEERKKNLHFVVVGGGPTGVEFAASLHDFVTEDLSKLYPSVQHLVKISLIEAADHILTMFDKRITNFAEDKFGRDGIDVKTGYKVVKVSKDAITMQNPAVGDISVPYGMAVWSTGIGTRPFIVEFMKQIGQGNRRVLATDEWLRVRECDGVYAVGDCATINQRKVMEDISEIFRVADKDKSGTLTVKEIQDILEDIFVRYPQVQLYLKSKQMNGIADLLRTAKGDAEKESMELNIEEFKKALSLVDSQVKFLPATAQVASQQGQYLARCFNKMKDAEENPEGPIRIRGEGRHRFLPFRYRHLGQFAPLGGEQTAAQLPGDWISIGHSSQWLWYSVYAT
ncbi:hypothetical protein PR202_gb28834 [Eleusine coracana subsp. coracana]|uniref:NADH:ubiquinone reductase (non-electrogenic) n=1 Tax=Eleusine coracana subsp. coracana TaxID=191504 RepID=A0AAV5FVM8_ELECO|nr:hypothetical protein PR202_gb28834 [Eleusine coracana subsp. coracana]